MENAFQATIRFYFIYLFFFEFIYKITETYFLFTLKRKIMQFKETIHYAIVQSVGFDATHKIGILRIEQ